MTKNSISPMKPFIVKSFYDWSVHNDIAINLKVMIKNYDCVLPKEIISKGNALFDMRSENVKDVVFTENLYMEFQYLYKKNWTSISFPSELVIEAFVFDDKDNVLSHPFDYFETSLKDYEKSSKIIDINITKNNEVSPFFRIK
jgi:stringent starvation protein B